MYVDGCDGFQESSVWNAKEAKRYWYIETETTGQCEGDSAGVVYTNFDLLITVISLELWHFINYITYLLTWFLFG